MVEHDPARRPNAAELCRWFEDLLGPSAALDPATSTLHITSRKGSDEPAPLLGRDAVIQQLLDAHQSIGARGATLVMLRGASGVGKTTLLEAFRSRVGQDPGGLVFVGRSTERESLPFKGLDGAIDELCQYLSGLDTRERALLLTDEMGALAQLFPVFQTLAGAEVFTSSAGLEDVRKRAARGLADLLSRLGTKAVVTLVLDDAQWADADSAHLLGELCLSADLRLMIVIAHRDTGAPGEFLPLFERLVEPVRWAAAPRALELRPLDRDTSEALLRRYLAGHELERDLVDRLLDSADGSPLLIEEMALAARTASLDQAQPQRISKLETILDARIASLSPDARHILELLTVAAAPMDLPTLVRASGVGTGMHDALALLRAKRLVKAVVQRTSEAHTTAFEIGHARVGQLLAGWLAHETARARHRALAQALLATSDPPASALVYHLQHSGDADRAIEFAFEAAERARATLAFDGAASHYAEALKLTALAATWPPSLPPRAHVEDRLLEMLVASGHSADAAAIFAEKARTATGTRRLELEIRALEHWLIAGRLAEGLAVLDPLLKEHRLRRPKTTFGSGLTLVGRLTRLKLMGGSSLAIAARSPSTQEAHRIDAAWAVGKALTDILPLDALSFQLQSLLLSARAGDRERSARAMAAFGGLWVWQGTPRAISVGHGYMRRADELLGDGGALEVKALVQIVTGAHAVTTGHWDLALASVQEGRATMARSGQRPTWESNMAHLVESLALEATCRMRQLRALGLQWRQAARARGDIFAEITSLIGSAVSMIADDAVGEMRERLRVALGRWPMKATVQQFSVVPIEVGADLYEGSPERAWERINEAWRGAKAAQLFRASIIRIKYRVARASAALELAARRQGEARRGLVASATSDARALEREVRADATAWSSVIQGSARWIDGDRATALSRFDEALARFDSTGMDVHAASVRLMQSHINGGADASTTAADDRRHLIWRGVRDPDRWITTIVPGVLV